MRTIGLSADERRTRLSGQVEFLRDGRTDDTDDGLDSSPEAVMLWRIGWPHPIELLFRTL